jgi:hypothetical protein
MADEVRAVDPNDMLTEHARLVARGVRVLALPDIGCGWPKEPSKLHIAHRLECAAWPAGALAFLIEYDDGAVTGGFAAAPWVIDLYRWVCDPANNIPRDQGNRIVGLMLGYSAEAIAAFDAKGIGRMWKDAPVARPVAATMHQLPLAAVDG